MPNGSTDYILSLRLKNDHNVERLPKTVTERIVQADIHTEIEVRNNRESK